MKNPDFDEARAEAFEERMFGMLNDAALALMTSIGLRAGLFDTLAILPPATSAQVAEAAGLEEQGVRQWLSVMATGGVVEYDGGRGTFELPPEHAAALSSHSPSSNLTSLTEHIRLLGLTQDSLVASFKDEDGLTDSAGGRRGQALAENHDQAAVSALLPNILSLVPSMTDQLEEGIDVLHMGCGRGRMLLALARRFPSSCFIGYDLSVEAIAAARTKAMALGLTNVRFERRDPTRLDEWQEYDWIMSLDGIRVQALSETVMRRIHRALRPLGWYLMQGIRLSSYLEKNLNHPLAPLLYTISTMRSIAAASLADRAQAGVSAFGTHLVGVTSVDREASLSSSLDQETTVRMLGSAGFTDIRVHLPGHDLQSGYYTARKQ